MPKLDSELSGILAQSREIAQEYCDASQASRFERGLVDENGVLTEVGEAQQQAFAREFVGSFPEPSDPEEVRALGGQVLQHLRNFDEMLGI